MTIQQKDDIAHIVMASMQIQSALHTLDNITGEGNNFKFKKKKDWNDFISYVKRFAEREGIELYDLTGTIKDQAQNYIDCVNEFDKVAEEMKIIIPD